MSLGIHALDIPHIEPILRGRTGSTAETRADEATPRQTTAGADECAFTAANRRACRCPDGRTGNSAHCTGCHGGAIRCDALYLAQRELAANGIVTLKGLKASSRAW